MARACMRSFVVLVLLTSVALAGDKAPPMKFTDFAGPAVKPPVLAGTARVVAPIQGSDWHKSLAFYDAKVLRAEGSELVIEGIHGEVFVPGAFVAPPPDLKPLKVGALVRFQEQPGLFWSADIGRVAKVAKTDDGIVYTVKSYFVDEVKTAEVPAARVRAVDGKLTMGQPITFELDGEPCFGVYVAPGREAGSAWVLSVGYAREKSGVKPLVIKKFAKGAKVRVSISTTSVMKAGVQQETRQLLENATIVEVIAGGLAYKVKRGDGKISEAELGDVFAR